MWDNLSLYKTAYAVNLIYDRATTSYFVSIDRPPYMPKISLIEYVLCELPADLSCRINED